MPLENLVYHYTDENGYSLYRVVRTPDKQFWQEHYRDGEWVKGLNGVDRVLYRLPDLLRAPRETPILICEGEKAVEAAMSAGFVATTTCGGANSWVLPHKLGYINSFYKRRVYIIPDNDNPGEEYAQAILGDLASVAEFVGIIRLGGEKGDDVYDWLGNGHTSEELWEKILLCPRAVPRKGQTGPVILQRRPDSSISQDIKALADIDIIVGKYTRLGEVKNHEMWVCCPIHKEKTPSMKLNLRTRRFKCFGCGCGGDVYDFLMEVEKIPFCDAFYMATGKRYSDLLDKIDPEEERMAWKTHGRDLLKVWYALYNMSKRHAATGSDDIKESLIKKAKMLLEELAKSGIWPSRSNRTALWTEFGADLNKLPSIVRNTAFSSLQMQLIVLNKIERGETWT